MSVGAPASKAALLVILPVFGSILKRLLSPPVEPVVVNENVPRPSFAKTSLNAVLNTDVSIETSVPL